MTNVNINFGRPAPRKRGGGRPPKCTFDCAFCGGTGKDPDSIISEEMCRVCKGKGKITKNISCKELIDCAFCEGKGVDPNSIVSLEVCPVCLGTGKVQR
ncbi:hypothetical protein ES707_02123 [subsurface metagenome]